MTEEEQRILEVISLPNRKDRFQSEKFKDGVPKGYRNDKDNEQEQNVYYVPLLWAADLVNKAFDEGRIKNPSTLKTLIEVCNDVTITFLNAYNSDVLKRYLDIKKLIVFFFFVGASCWRRSTVVER